MPVYEATVTDSSEIPVAGALGYIYVEGVLADLTDDLGAPLSNPITSDALGYAKATVPSINYTVKWNWLGKERFVETFRVGGTDPLAVQNTGWTAATGTANKGAFATYAGATHTGSYVQATIQALDNAAKNNSQRIKAIEDALRALTLIT